MNTNVQQRSHSRKPVIFKLLLWVTVKKTEECTASDFLPSWPSHHCCPAGRHLKVVALVDCEEEESPPRTVEGRVERHDVEPTGVPLVLDGTHLAAEGEGDMRRRGGGGVHQRLG